MRRLLRLLARDMRGHILIYFTILLPVMLGFIGLSLEGGRLLMLNSQLQDLADASALAAAKELDGKPDSIDRADAAAALLASNNDPWWTFVANVGVQIDTAQTVYYSAIRCIPDCTKSPADVVALTQAEATAVKVVTLDKSITPAFLVSVGALTPATTRATATAISQYVACNVQPLMLCNPQEPNAFSATPGALYGFTPTGSTGGYSPGDFSLLDPAGQTHSGSPDIAKLLSDSKPNFCYLNNVSPAQGQKTIAVSKGINVRFDIDPGGGPNSGLTVTPAPNVVKGNISGKCLKIQDMKVGSKDLNLDYMMPGNTPMTQVGSAYVGGSLDIAKANTYWNYHHGTNWPTDSTTGQPLTRQQAYAKERDGTAPFLPGTEANGPSCSGVATGDDNRRILDVAIIDCLAQNVQGNSNVNLLATKYAEFFLIQPVIDSGGGSIIPGQPGGNVVYAEFVKYLEPGTGNDSKLHHIVQLIRDY